MTDETNSAGDEARTDRDAPPSQKPAAYDLGRGELHVPDEDAVLLTDGGTTIPRFSDLSALQRDILLLLAWSQPSDGAGLQTDLESQQGTEVPHPTFYKNLDKLADRGLVEKLVRDRDNRSNTYRLTDAGRQSVRRAAERAKGAANALDDAEVPEVA